MEADTRQDRWRTGNRIPGWAALILIVASLTAAPAAGVPAEDDNAVNSFFDPLAAPANDTCGFAIDVAVPSVIAGTTVNATLDGDAPFCGLAVGAPGVWYKVVGTGGIMTAHTCNAASYDTQVTVYRGSCGALDCVRGRDDGCSGSHRTWISWRSQPGATYFILVHGYSGQTGTFQLSVSSQSAPDARTINVNAAGTGDYPTIQAAINAANHGDTIVLAPGVYTGSGNRDLFFSNKAITVRSTNPADPDVVVSTVIDCQHVANSRAFWFIDGEASDSRIDGLTLRNGNVSAGSGGAVVCDHSSPTIANCLVSGNSAPYGGGIGCGGETRPTITGCTVTDNVARTMGGGIFCWNSVPTIEYCTVRNNALSEATNWGGGIYLEDAGTATITGCQFLNNAAVFGAGVYCQESDGLHMTDCTMEGNVAVAAPGTPWAAGGGVALWESNTVLTNCAIRANVVRGEEAIGGGIYSGESISTISGCTIDQNEVDWAGGGICGYSAATPRNDPTITACTIRGNTAGRAGAGLYDCDGPIDGCEITGNTADGPGSADGGGLWGCGGLITNCLVDGNAAKNNAGGFGNCDGTIRNCIIASNSADYGGGLGFCDGVIENCRVIYNTASSHGGGLRSCMGTIRNCEIVYNNAGDAPGGAYSNGGGLSYCDGQIGNCLIAGNHADDGAGLEHCMGRIANCLIAGNLADRSGGGLLWCDGEITNCTIVGNSAVEAGGLGYGHGLVTSCIIWGNRDNIGSDQLYNWISLPAYCDIQDWTGGGVGNTTATPLFVMDTGTWQDSDYHLLGGSPCIDAGDPAFGCNPTDASTCSDYDGTPRIRGARVDQGAYEAAPPLAGPYLYPFPRRLSFSTMAGGPPPAPQTVAVYNTGSGSLSWTVAANVGWLRLGPGSPPTGGAGATFTVGVDTTGVQVGEHTGIVTVTDANANNNPQNVTVELHHNGPRVHNLTRDQWYGMIQAAVTAASAGDEIEVLPGRYNERISFNGKDIVLRGTNGVTNLQATTIIDGDLDHNPGTYEGPVVQFDGPETAACVLAGFTITGGASVGLGGGIDCGQGAAPTIRNCTITRNTTTYRGGGICCHKNSGPTISNCIIGNNTSGRLDAGAVLCADFSNVRLTNCTIVDNSGGILCWPGANLTLRNCILADNGVEMYLNTSAGPPYYPSATVSYCDVAGGREAVTIMYDLIDGVWQVPENVLIWGPGNIDAYLSLTPDRHLRSGCGCIDTGDPQFVIDPAAPTDLDGESRIAGGRVDIGADEFIDSDGDRLPDWWEATYFGSSTAANAGDDPDADGLTNLEEYEQYGSNPIAPVYYVDGVAGNDAWNGRAPAPAGGDTGPKKTIQAAIDAAIDGDTVLVAPGLYAGAGNFNLDFHGKPVVVRKRDGAGGATMDCGGAGRAVRLESVKGTFAVLEGFTISGGNADYGGGLRYERARFMLKSCTITGNTATGDGGGIHSEDSSPTFEDLIIHANVAPPGHADAAFFTNSHVHLQGLFSLSGGTPGSTSRLDVAHSWFDGPGRIDLGPYTKFYVSDTSQGYAVFIRSNVTGTGMIEITPGQQLIVEGTAIVDLGDGQGGKGEILVDGKLIAREQSTIRNARVNVRQASISTDTPIQFNDIHLVESLSAGGEFFVEDVATVAHNDITSEGDRYLDLDPDPAATERPTIDHNTIRVLIETNPALPRGTLLELRARDYECESGGVNPACDSGARQAPVTGRFESDPAQNWILEELEIKPGAKLNLTNRPGFEYRTDTAYAETVYVKTLKLHPDAVLNTALLTLYYENLVDENNDPMERPSDPAQPLPNGSRITDVPLLGFSLGIIAFDDETASPFNEFDIRVEPRLRDPYDVQPPLPAPPLEGSITREPNPISGTGGLMDVRTQANGKQAASSVAAKGSFARAGDEDIVIAFEYLFIDNPDAEIVVRLSDKQDVGVRSFEVARVRMPPAGRAGSLGSGQFAIFYGQFPRVQPGVYDRNFTRGTYVELELIASRDAQDRPVSSRVWIDNLDPLVICSRTCGDFTKNGVSEDDFLVLLAEYGRTLGSTDPKACLDSQVNRDHYVDLTDLLGWDSLFDGRLNACGTGGLALAAGAAAATPASLPSFPPDSLLVAGKPKEPTGGQLRQQDALYSLNATGQCLGNALNPASVPDPSRGYRGNGRLIRDGQGNLYQLHGTQGLIRLSDGQVVIPPPAEPLPTYNKSTVYVGVKPGANALFTGMPITDAAFDSTNSNIVYVAPVMVSVPAADSIPAHSYRAAAKLLRTGPGTYNLVRLYGADPYHDPLVTATPPETSPYNVQKLRELELDRSRRWLFVAAAHGLNNNELNDNDWLLVYDTASGAEQRIQLTSLSSWLHSPTALLASPNANMLYLASSVNASTDAQVCRLAYNPSNGSLSPAGQVVITGMRQVTALAQAPGSGDLHVLGFYAEGFSEDYLFKNTDPIFTTPKNAIVGPDVSWTNPSQPPVPSSAITCSGLALPVSMMHVSSGGPWARADFNRDGHVDQADVSYLVGCATGPAVPQSNPACLPPNPSADLDGDGDVDQSDFSILQLCYSGEDDPANPGCGE